MENIGTYTVLRSLGAGSYGKVLLAVDPSGQQVAIKAVGNSASNVVRTREAIHRAREEADVMRALDHPNVVPLLDFVDANNSVNLVMPYYPGGDLLDHVQAHGPLSEAATRGCFLQLARALLYLHQAGYVHRDIKPDNVFIAGHDLSRLVIGDLGFAGPWSPTAKQSVSLGSIHYAAPEICSGTPYRGPEVDVWSLGVLLYVLLTARMPFGGSDDFQIYKQISSGTFSPVKGVSAECQRLLKAMMCPCRKSRWSLEDVLASPWCQASTVPRLVLVRRRPSHEADRVSSPGRARAPDSPPAIPEPLSQLAAPSRRTASCVPSETEDDADSTSADSPRSTGSTPRASASRKPSRFMATSASTGEFGKRFSLSQLLGKLVESQAPPSP